MPVANHNWLAVQQFKKLFMVTEDGKGSQFAQPYFELELMHLYSWCHI